MKITNIDNLKIHKLTQEQYQYLVDNNQIDETAIYMTPDAGVIGGGVTIEEVNAAIAAIPSPDWAQMDESASDYIKNRPFGDELSEYYIFEVENVIFEDAGIITADEQPLYKATGSHEPLVLNEEYTYIVESNSDYFEVYAHYHNGQLVLGNPSYVDSEAEDTWDHFYFTIDEAGNWEFYSADSTTREYLTITERSITTLTIDPRYLPDDISAQPDWNMYDETNPSYIQNRTHYEDYTEQSFGDLTGLTFTPTDELIDELLVYHALTETDLRFTLGTTYAVEWPDFWVAMPAVDYVGMIALGNLHLIEPEVFPVDSIPFLILQDATGAVEIFSNTENNPEELHFREGCITLKQLDEKFIPDTIMRVADMPLPAEISSTFLYADLWAEGAYSFEDLYPSDTYDIKVEFDGDSGTIDQLDAFSGAQIVGSRVSNILKSLGDVPIIDIPIFLKVQVK